MIVSCKVGEKLKTSNGIIIEIVNNCELNGMEMRIITPNDTYIEILNEDKNKYTSFNRLTPYNLN